MAEDGKLVHGGWLVCRWEGSEGPSVIEGGAFYEEGGRIIKVGIYEELRKQYPRATSIGGSSYVVIPGFVNAHSHGRGFTTFQMGQPDEPLETRIAEMAFRSEWGGGDSEPGTKDNRGYDPYLDTLYACIKQIAAGITTTVHSHVYMDGPVGPYADLTRRMIAAYRDSGIRCAFALGIRDRYTYTFMDDQAFLSSLPPGVQDSPQLRLPDYKMGFSEFYELLQALSEEFPGVGFQFGPWNPVWCSDALMERLAEASRDDGWRVHTHLMETQYQSEYARRTYGKSWVAHLNEMGMLSERFSGAHGVWLDRSDMDMMKEAGAQVVYNPSSNMRLGSGLAPVREFLSVGVPVAFGLDSLGMNDDEDMFQDLRLGQTIQNGPGIDRGSIPACTLFEMATGDGATVAGIDGIGSIAEGNRADAVLLSLPQIEGGHADQPLPDLILRRAKAAHVKTVVIGGKVMIEDGRWIAFEPDKILGELSASLGRTTRVTSETAQVVKEAVRVHMRGYHESMS